MAKGVVFYTSVGDTGVNVFIRERRRVFRRKFRPRYRTQGDMAKTRNDQSRHLIYTCVPISSLRPYWNILDLAQRSVDPKESRKSKGILTAPLSSFGEIDDIMSAAWSFRPFYIQASWADLAVTAIFTLVTRHYTRPCDAFWSPPPM